MKDNYNIQNVQQQKTKSKKKEDVILEEEARRIQKQNLGEVKGINKTLEDAKLKHKSTTKEMEKQNEALKVTKKSAINVHKQAGQAEETTQQLEDESNLFCTGFPFFRKIKNLFTRDYSGERDIKKMEEKNDEIDYSDSSSSSQSIEANDEVDEELKKTLANLKDINRENKRQTKLGEQQATDLRDIERVDDLAEKKVKRVDEALQKQNKK